MEGCQDTLGVARGCADRNNVTVIALKENRGTYVTLNTRMHLADSDFICHFDADDVMMPGYLTQQTETIEAGMDMTMTWRIYTDAPLPPTTTIIVYKYPDIHREDGLHPKSSVENFVIRRHVWKNLGGFRPWRCRADSDFLIGCAAQVFDIK